MNSDRFKQVIAEIDAAMAAMLAITSVASANKYVDTIALFKHAGESSTFFDSCYGYAVFPTIGKGGLIVGGAHGSCHVYEKGKYSGDTSVTQLSVGFQAGGQAYSPARSEPNGFGADTSALREEIRRLILEELSQLAGG